MIRTFLNSWQYLLLLITCLNYSESYAGISPKIVLDNPMQNVGENKLNLRLLAENEHQLHDVKISFLATMPAMGSMPTMEEHGEVTKKSLDSYDITYELTMGGSWSIALTIESKEFGTEVFQYSATTGLAGFVDKNAPKTDGAIKPSSTDLRLTPDRIQRIGVRFTEAKKMRLKHDLRAIGIVESDSAKRSEIVTRFSAYVVKYTNKRVGDPISNNEILATVDSPELVAAQQEFIFAQDLQGGAHLSGSGAVERLINLGLTKSQIETIQKTKNILRQLDIRANSSGTLLESNIRPGTKIEAGQVLFVIGDLSKNYLIVKIFQQDLINIKVGQTVDINLPGQDGSSYTGKIDLIMPNSSEGTGTINVRVVPDEIGILTQPGVYAEINIPIYYGEKLSVPNEALLYSGIHTYVFLDKGNGVLSPTEVKIGRQVDDYVEIVAGLKENDRVVASGTFLLSAEASFRSALPKWSNPEKGGNK